MIGDCDNFASNAVTSVSKGLVPGGLFAEATTGFTGTSGAGFAGIGVRFVSALLAGGGLFAEATAGARDPGGAGGGELGARVASAADKMLVNAKRMIEVPTILLNKPESIGARTRPKSSRKNSRCQC